MKKNFNVKYSKEVIEKLDDLSDKDYNKIFKGIKELVKKLEKGENPGTPIDWIKPKNQLACNKCKSENVEWLLDRNSNEVDFSCYDCKNHFWMTLKDYENAVRNNPDCIIV